MSLVNGESSNNVTDIHNFIKIQNYDFDCDIWFTHIWSPLFHRTDILITSNILSFLYRGKTVSPGIKERFPQYETELKSHLKTNQINFNEIHFHEDILEDYEVLKDEIKNISSKEWIDKKWMELKFDDFEKAIMHMNTSNSKYAKDYFITLKKIYFDYTNHIHEQELKAEKIKNLELSRINANMNVFIQNIKAKTMNGYIYISTSHHYASENKFKVGMTENLKALLDQFNNMKRKEDSFYFCFYEKCYNINNIEKVIHDVLNDFKDINDNEIFVLHYSVLVELVKLVITNINQPYDYNNYLVSTRIKEMYNLKPHIPEPMEVNGEKILLDEMKSRMMTLMDIYA